MNVMKKLQGMYLLDSSAIAIILIEKREDAFNLLRGRATISLAYYELCNILWKEAFLLKLVDTQVALKTAEHLAYILSEMHVENLSSPKDLYELMKVALETGLTAYDASYLYAAEKLSATLVTEDNKLSEAAKKRGVNVISTSHYLNEK
ncbi:MAG: type II toxin-antitoxin system VapC family toxin [Candidatus Asgardarchaeia archaeon]